MTVFAESSAVLAWLLGEAAGEEVATILGSADHVVVSELLLLECRRACVRAEVIGALTTDQAVDARSRLSAASAHWQSMPVSSSLLERSAQPFPVEPVRSLDSIHLSSALLAATAIPEMRVVTLDQRIRDNARKLGLAVAPRG